MMQITNLTKTKIEEKSLKTAARTAAAVLGNKIIDDISLVLVGDAEMKSLNKKYRGKNKTTDVLSFDGLNEIFICLPQAKKQANPPSLKLRRANLLKTALKTELIRLLVHGIVHLKGYDHEKSVKDAERMFAVEDKILKNL